MKIKSFLTAKKASNIDKYVTTNIVELCDQNCQTDEKRDALAKAMEENVKLEKKVTNLLDVLYVVHNVDTTHVSVKLLMRVIILIKCWRD